MKRIIQHGVFQALKAGWKSLLLIILMGISVQAQNIDLLGAHDHRTIPFTMLGNFILIDVTIDHSISCKFIIDTGSEHVILFEKSMADILQFTYTHKIPIIGSDLKYRDYALIAPRIPMQIEGLNAFQANILVLEETYPSLNPLINADILGIIGGDLLSQYNLEINYRKRTLTFYKHSTRLPIGKRYSAIPLYIYDDKPYCLAVTGEKDNRDLFLLLDTGCTVNLILHKYTLEDSVNSDTLVYGVIGRSIHSQLLGYIGRLHSFRWGAFTFPGMLVNYQAMDSSVLNIQGRAGGRDGIIGNVLLERFHLFIDYRDSMLYLKPRKYYNREFKYDRSGMGLIATGVDFSDYVVEYVVPGSPADSAGIISGDKIMSINFWPVFLYSFKHITEVFKGPVGKKIRLRIKRGNDSFIVYISLRKLI